MSLDEFSISGTDGTAEEDDDDEPDETKVRNEL
jgi:hypothetical protein